MHAEREHRLASAILWTLSGFVAEGAAALALLRAHAWAALVWHVGSAAAFGLLAAGGQARARRAALMVAFALVLTLPVLGALGVSSVLVPAWRARRPAEVDDILEVGMPEFGSDIKEHAPVPIEHVLRNSTVVRERVASVMALRRMNAQFAVPLLRVALSDADEDVRLLAYAILERREKDLRGRIDAALADLSRTQGEDPSLEPAPRAAFLRALAEHHWELVNGGFVGEELRAETLDAAMRYGDESLSLVPDGTLTVLLARTRLRRGDGASALEYLRRAGAMGMANAVLAPLYAEAAFLMRRFDAIGPLLVEAGSMARPRLDDVVRFWTEGRDE